MLRKSLLQPVLPIEVKISDLEALFLREIEL